MRLIHIVAGIAALALAVSPALANRGGNGNGAVQAAASDATTTSKGNGHGHSADPAPASCSVSGNVVSATGLPTDQVINFMITDDSGTWGWVLGFTDTGTWDVYVPTQTGPTTYEFASRTWGPNGSKYNVFASCSA